MRTGISTVEWVSCWCNRGRWGTERNWGSGCGDSRPPSPVLRRHNRCEGDGRHEHSENCQHGKYELIILGIQIWIISMGNFIKCKILHISSGIKNIRSTLELAKLITISSIAVLWISDLFIRKRNRSLHEWESEQYNYWIKGWYYLSCVLNWLLSPVVCV